MVRPVRSVFYVLLAVLLGSLVTSPATAAPDLTCTIESSVTESGEVTLTMTVTNSGDATAENKTGFEGGFLYRDLAQAPAGEFPDNFVAFDSLAVGGSAQVVDTFSTIPGTYKAWCEANPDIAGFTVPDETNFSNNVNSHEYTVEEPPVAAPDLVITAVDPATEDGLTFTFSVTVENIGTAATGTFQVDVYGHSPTEPTFTKDTTGDVFCSFPEGVGEGESLTVECSNSYTVAAPGSYTAWAFVDLFAEITDESDTTNNSFGPTEYNAGPADLLVSSMVVNTDLNAVTYLITVANEGGIVAKGVDFCLYYDSAEKPSGTPDAIKNLLSLGVDQSVEIQFDREGAPNGEFMAWGVADCNDTVLETDEDNNAISQTYTIQGPPNEAPTMDGVEGPSTCNEAELCTWTASATDTTLLPLKFRVTVGPPGMWADPLSGVIYFVPPLGSTSPSLSTTVEVVDGGGMKDSLSFEFFTLPVDGFDGVVGAVGSMPLNADQSACAMVEVPGAGFAYVRQSDYMVSFFEHTGKPTGALSGSTELIVGKDYPIPNPLLSCHVEGLPGGGFALLELTNNTALIYGSNGTLIRKIELEFLSTVVLLSEHFVSVGAKNLAFLDVEQQKIIVVDVTTGALEPSWGGNQKASVDSGIPGILDLYDTGAPAFYPYEGYLWSDGAVIRIYNEFFGAQQLVDYAPNGSIQLSTHIGALLPCGGTLSAPCPPDVGETWTLQAAPDGGIQFVDTLSAALHWYDWKVDEEGGGTLTPRVTFSLPPPNLPSSQTWPAGWVSMQAYGLSANNLSCEALGAGGFTCHDRAEERGFVIDEFGEFWENCPKLDVSPTVLNFGGIPAGLKKTIPILVANKNGGVLYITDVQLIAGEDSLGLFSIPALEESALLYPGQLITVEATYSPDGPGQHGATVSFTSNACDGLNVTLSGHSGPRVDVSPSPIEFKGVSVGKDTIHERAVTIRNIGSDDLDITAVSLEQIFPIFYMIPPSIEPQTLMSGDTIELKVLYPANVGDEVSAKLVVESSDPAQSTLEIDVLASTESQVRAKPTGFSFGTVALGDIRTRIIELTNTGFTSAEFAEIQVSGPPGFEVDTSNWNPTLEPNGYSFLKLSYTALNVGSAVARVLLFPTDPTQPTLVLSAVAGTGTHLGQGFDGQILLSGEDGAFDEQVGVGQTVIELQSGGFAVFGQTSQSIHVVTGAGEPDPWFGVNGTLSIATPEGAFPQATDIGKTLIEMVGSGFAMLSADSRVVYAVGPDGQPNYFVGNGGVIALNQVFPDSSMQNIGDTLVQLPNENLALIARDTVQDFGTGASTNFDKLLVFRLDGIPDIFAGGSGEVVLAGPQSLVGIGTAEGFGDSLVTTPTGGMLLGDTETNKFYTLSGIGASMNESPGTVASMVGRLVPFEDEGLLFYSYDPATITALQYTGSSVGLDPGFGDAGVVALTDMWPTAVLGKGATGLRSGTGFVITDTDCDCLRFGTVDGTTMILEPEFSAVVPTKLTFSNVPVGQVSTPQGFDVTNAGTYPLHLKTAFSSKNFHLASGAKELVIQPGDTATVSIVFEPNVIGVHSASVTLLANDPNNAEPATTILEGRTGPHLLVSPKDAVLDFGTVKQGVQLEKLVLLANDGTDPLSISTITLQGSNQFVILINPAGAGTAVIDPPATPGAAPPVKQLKLQFNPSTPGLHTALLTIKHDDPTQPETMIVLRGRSGAQLKVNPTSLTCVGLTMGTKSLCGTVSLSNAGTSVLTVGDIAIEGEGFEVIAAPGDVEPGGDPITAMVVVDPQHQGVSKGTLRVVHNDSIGGHFTTVPLEAHVRGAMALVPDEIQFGAVPVGGSVTTPVSVTTSESETYHVLAATVVGNPAIKLLAPPSFPATASAASPVELAVRCAPTLKGNAVAELIVVTDALGSTTLRAPLHCVTGPSLVATPGALDFGAVTVNQVKILPIKITHEGTGTVSIGSVSLVGLTSAFALVQAPKETLLPGESTQATVRFQPGIEMEYTPDKAKLKLVSATSGKTLLQVPLSGRSGPGLSIVGATTPLDFGALGIGKTTTRRAAIVNTGSESVIVQKVIVNDDSGAFSVLDAPANAQALDASESLFVTLRFSPVSIGAYSGELTVTSTAAPVSLDLVGSAGGVLRVNPGQLAFGETAIGETRSLPLLIANIGHATPITVHYVAGGDMDGFTLQGLNSLGTVLAPGEVLENVQVVFAPERNDDYDATLTFYTDKGVPSDSIDVVLAGKSGAQPKLIYPIANFLNFRNVSVGAYETQPVHLAAMAPSSTQVLGYSISGDAAFFELEGLDDLPSVIAGGDVAELGVICHPVEAGVFVGQLRLETDSTASPTVSITLRCATSPNVTITPARVNFGSVLPFTEHTAAVVFENVGFESLGVQTASVENVGDLSGFSLAEAAPNNLTLFPGEKMAIPVLFAPDDPGAFAGIVTVTTNDAVQSVISVPLDGISGPALRTDPSALNFCSTQTELALNLVNGGKAPVEVISVKFAAAETSGVNLIWPGGTQPGEGTPPPYPIDVGESEQLKITFGAISTGHVATEQIVVSSTDAATPEKSVRILKGKGLVLEDQFTGIADVGPPTSATVAAFDELGNIGSAIAELCTGGFVMTTVSPHELVFVYPLQLSGALALDAWGKSAGALDLGDLILEMGLDPTQGSDLGSILTSLDDGTIIIGSPAMATYIFLQADGSIDRSRLVNGVLRLDDLLEDVAIGGAIAPNGDGYVVADRRGKRLVGVNADGSLDTLFGQQGVVTMSDLALEDDVGLTFGESMVVLNSGSIAVTDGTSDTIIVIKPDGSLDVDFGTNGVLSLTNADLNGAPLVTTGAGLAKHGSGFAITDQATGRMAFLYDTGDTNISIAAQGIAQVTGVTGLYAQAGGMSGSMVGVRHAATSANQGTLVVIDDVNNDLLFVTASDGSGVSQNLAELSIDCPLVIDDVDPNSTKTLQGITLSNSGDTFLKIGSDVNDAVSVSSGNVVCTGEGFTCAAGTTLGSGDGTAISLAWSPKGQPGCYDEKVQLFHDGVNGPVTTCPLLLRTKAHFESIPAAPAYNFPPQAVGASYTREFIIRNTGCAKLPLDDLFLSSTTEFDLEKGVGSDEELPTLQPGETHKFWVTCRPTKQGSHNTVLQFSLKQLDPPDAVNLTCVSGPLLEAVPTKLSWGAVDVGGAQLKELTLQSSGGEPVSIDLEAITIEGPGASGFELATETLKSVLAAGESVSTTVVFIPKEIGEFKATLTIASNSYEPVVVELSGLTSPDVLFDPDPVDFGYTAAGTENIQTVTINNIGAGYLSLDPDPSSLEGTPFSCIQCQELGVTPGSPVTLKFACNPDGPGEYTATMRFDSNAQSAEEGQQFLALSCRSGAAIDVTPDTLNWGTVISNTESTTRFVTVRNEGSDELNVTLSSIDDPAGNDELTFESPTTFTVDAEGGEKQIIVRLTPLDHPHTINAVFQINSDALNAPEGGIPIAMTAVVDVPASAESEDLGVVDQAEGTLVPDTDAGSGDLGPGPDPTPPGGCGCRTTGPVGNDVPVGGALIVLLFAWVASRLRRRWVIMPRG